MESITLKSAPRAHSSGSLHILPCSTFGEDSILISNRAERGIKPTRGESISWSDKKIVDFHCSDKIESLVCHNVHEPFFDMDLRRYLIAVLLRLNRVAHRFAHSQVRLQTRTPEILAHCSPSRARARSVGGAQRPGPMPSPDELEAKFNRLKQPVNPNGGPMDDPVDTSSQRPQKNGVDPTESRRPRCGQRRRRHRRHQQARIAPIDHVPDWQLQPGTTPTPGVAGYGEFVGWHMP